MAAFKRETRWERVLVVKRLQVRIYGRGMIGRVGGWRPIAIGTEGRKAIINIVGRQMMAVHDEMRLRITS